MFGRRRKQDDFNAEVEAHIALETDRLKEQGLSDEEAQMAARRAFGNVTQAQERFYESGRWVWWDQLLQDLRYGFRQLRRNPGFTVVAVLTLALGIAANTTIFSSISAILLRKPPVKDPGRLCALASVSRTNGSELARASAPDFKSWQEMNHVFEGMAAALTGRPFTLTGMNEPESVPGELVTPGYFKIIGIAPSLGRAFLPSEGQAGNDHVVILSNSLWHERYGADPKVIGKDTKINGQPYTIVGVMPPKAAMPMPFSPPLLWTPLVFSTGDLAPSARANHYINTVVARLRPGVTLQEARAEMNSVAHQLAQSYPKTDKDWGVAILTLQEFLIRRRGVRNALMILMVSVGLVLLLACANIAGLLLARGTGRGHEMAVRTAVGASRSRLVRQMLAESMLIGVAGGAAGLLMSVWGIHLLRAGFNFNAVSRQMAAGLRLDQPTLLFTLAVSLLTTFVFGLVPALHVSNANARNAMSEGARMGSGGFARSRLRSALATGEVALALVLLAGAGVITREVAREFKEPNGFNARHLLAADINLKGREFQKPAAQIAFLQQVTEKLQNVAGVESATVTMGLPLNGSWNTPFRIVGRPPVPESKQPQVDYFVVGPGYFRTMQIPLMQGREFSDSDNVHAPVVAVVNREFARRFFPKGDAIGQRMEVATGQHKVAQIVGIVGNVNDYLGQISPHAQIYECYLQIPFSGMSLVVRSRVAPSALAPALRRTVWSVDRNQPVANIQTMQQIVNENEGGNKLFTALMGIFAALALVLAAVGIYGVVAYSVNQRTREIGVRMALGAQRKDVLRLVLRRGCLLTGVGCAAGSALALPLPRILGALLSGGIAPQGPLVPITVALIVAIVSLLACYIPARRAAKVDPMVALRYE